MGTILIVEDNQPNAEILSRFLRRDGYRVLRAVNGREGLDMAIEHTPNLILMDLGLPVMDGWEATKRLKREGKTRDIPVVALTAEADPQGVVRAIEIGFDDYETKPLNYTRLMKKVSALLRD